MDKSKVLNSSETGGSKKRVQFYGELPETESELKIASDGMPGRDWVKTNVGGDSSPHHSVLNVEEPRVEEESRGGGHNSSDEFYGDEPSSRSSLVGLTLVFGGSPERSLANHSDEREDPSEDDADDDNADDPSDPNTMKKKSRQRAPEQRITLFALRLALIEKGASGLGTLSFLWATVVILGGFATTVNETDFWVVTLIILAESSRIFSRSHELEWQQLSIRSHESLSQRFLRAASSKITWVMALKCKVQTFLCCKLGGESSSVPGSTSGRPTTRSRLQPSKTSATPAADGHDYVKRDRTRTWNTPSLQLLPYAHGVITTKIISRLLYAVQLQTATVGIALAIWRLTNQEYFYNPGNNQQQPPNIQVSMNVFYILSIVEAGLFLMERLYWEYRIRVEKLLTRVNDEAELGPENLELVTQFFYDVYSQCLKGSVFDGLEMDLVLFSITWLQAEDFKQQLGGARLLNRIVSDKKGKPRNDHFAADCLRRLGTTPAILERLVEMLSWSSKQEAPLLNEIALIICRLVMYNRNCSRIVAIPGSVEGIMSLLVPHEWPSKTDKNYLKTTEAYFNLSLNGLRILKYLCKDHKNSERIGEVRGLLSILILFIEARSEKAFTAQAEECIDPSFLPYRLKTYKKSLQVLSLLAAGNHQSGIELRRRISNIVSGLKNLGDIIQFGDTQPELQRSSLEILFHLAMDDNVKHKIGATGGMLRNLFNLFARYNYKRMNAFKECHLGPDHDATDTSERNILTERQLASVMAGKTLSRVVLDNERNCRKLVTMVFEEDKPFLNCMVNFLSNPLDKDVSPREIASSSAQILREVLDSSDEKVRVEVAKQSAQVVVRHLVDMKIRMRRTPLYEAYLGLASRVLEPLDEENYSKFLAGRIKEQLLQQLLRNLSHTPTTNNCPRIRRYSLELLITVHKKDPLIPSLLEHFNTISINRVLRSTLDSISEVENFCMFSGLVGVKAYTETMENLVVRAIRTIEGQELT